jgi:hypothetical protein
MPNRLAPDIRERFRCDGSPFGYPVMAPGRPAASRGAIAMRDAIIFGKLPHVPPACASTA